MKKNLNKRFIFAFFILLLFFSYATFVSAALEVSDYPKIPGLPELTTTSDLGDYVGYIFGIITYMAGAIAVISFAVGAVQLILSASSPSLAGEAKERMKGSILGLILTLSAIVILKTINPNIVSTTLTALPGVDGIYYTNNSSDKSAPESADTSSIPDGYKTLVYRCSNSNIAPTLLVWLFTNKSLDYSGGATTKRITCGGTVSLSSAGSFKTAYETPGIYFCMDGCSGDMCQGYMSGANLSLQDEISSPFKGNLKGVRIVNDIVNPDEYYIDPSEYYGVIFHKELGAANGGECTAPIVSTKNISCQTVSVPAFSADIFQWNKNDPDSSGDGITFYSEPYGWNADVQSGQADITKEEIKKASNNIFAEDADVIDFDFSYVESEEALFCDGNHPSCSAKDTSEECCPCTNLQECPGSILVKGDYIVGLYSYILDEKGNKTSRLYCQTFNDDVETLDAYKYVQPGSDVEYINIIPVKY